MIDKKVMRLLLAISNYQANTENNSLIIKLYNTNYPDFKLIEHGVENQSEYESLKKAVFFLMQKQTIGHITDLGMRLDVILKEMKRQQDLIKECEE